MEVSKPLAFANSKVEFLNSSDISSLTTLGVSVVARKSFLGLELDGAEHLTVVLLLNLRSRTAL